MKRVLVRHSLPDPHPSGGRSRPWPGGGMDANEIFSFHLIDYIIEVYKMYIYSSIVTYKRIKHVQS